jgi:hypothetical protein
MDPITKQALLELRAWCTKYFATILVSEDHKKRVQIIFDHDEGVVKVNFGQFDDERVTVILENYESID